MQGAARGSGQTKTELLSAEQNESSSAEKNLELLGHEKLIMAMSACSPESQSNPGLCKMKYGQQIQVILPPLLLSHKVRVEYCVQLWGPQQKKYIDLLEGYQRRATGLGYVSSENWLSWSCSA